MRAASIPSGNSQESGVRAAVFYALCRLTGATRHERYYRYATTFGADDQITLLRAIMDHATRHVPYYRSILPAGKDWAADLCRVPILEKSIIRANFALMKSDEMKQRKWYENASGGSTGTPLRIVQDDEYLDWSRASEFYFLRQFLLCEFAEMRKIVLWGSERDVFEGTIGVRAKVLNWLRQTMYLNAFKLTPEKLAQYADTINRFKPIFIKAYAGSLYEVARFAQKRGLKMHRPRVIYSAAETLRPFMRELIEEVFSCKVHNFYGSREVGAMAGECSRGKLHVFSFNNFLEVVDSEGRAVKPGEEGRVLVTTLHNLSMPLIRYDIGDTAVLGSACSCGNRLPTLENVTGRITDHFFLRDGTLVHGEYFTHLFYFRDWVAEFQVLQREVDLIEIYFVAQGELVQADRTEIDAKIRMVMGDSCRVEWNEVAEIPRTPHGKLLFTRSLVDPLSLKLVTQK